MALCTQYRIMSIPETPYTVPLSRNLILTDVTNQSCRVLEGSILCRLRAITPYLLSHVVAVSLMNQCLLTHHR